MRRHISGIHAHSELAGIEEEVCGDWGDGNVGGGVLHAFCVLVGAEDGDCVVGGSEGFQAFVALLAVVEAWGHAVDAEEGVGDEGGGCPFSGLDAVVGFDMAGDWNLG